MVPNKDKRVRIKVLNEEHLNGKEEWVVVCCMNSEICDAFFEVTNIERIDFVDYLSRWCYEDFNLELPFTTANDLRILKELVIDRYQYIYPHIHYNKAIERYNWMCVWVSERMGKEIKRHDKPRYNRLFRSAKNYCC